MSGLSRKNAGPAIVPHGMMGRPWGTGFSVCNSGTIQPNVNYFWTEINSFSEVYCVLNGNY